MTSMEKLSIHKLKLEEKSSTLEQKSLVCDRIIFSIASTIFIGVGKIDAYYVSVVKLVAM